MSEKSIERLFRLREELEALQSDPAMQELLSKKDALRSTIEELGLTEADAAALLVPESVTNKAAPLVYLAGRRRIPSSPVKKRLLQSNLMAVRTEVDHLLGRLDKDPEIQKRSSLIAAIQNLSISHTDAAELLAPGIMQDAQKGTSSKPQGSRRSRTWRNPHTEETVSAKSTNNKQLKAWVEEHGKGILTSWLTETKDGK